MDAKVAKLVDEALALDEEIKSRQEKLKPIKAKLLELGKGKHEGNKGNAIVVEPGPTLELSDDALGLARNLTDKDQFAKLFSWYRAVSFSDSTSFRQVARALLTPAKAEKLIAACEVSKESYVMLKPAK